MLDTRENIKEEIQQLLNEGGKIRAVFFDEKTGKIKTMAKIKLSALSSAYQKWYTKALALVKQLIPERLSEFEELYIRRQTSKQFSVSEYTISDFLLGIEITRGDGIFTPRESAFDTKSVFLSKFGQQYTIVESAFTRLDSILSNITGLVRAELLDNEIESARELFKSNYLRGAGTIASVVLESHLSQVCENRGISFTKKILHISDYNEALKQNNAYDIPTWRLIQLYNDIRILCCHAKQREPTKSEVSELIDGVEKAIKSIV